ncbi:MAG: AI-2E family transporter [Eubacteriales bacterium]|nr:AI-2E family transporter [Eubacteriales bacterium]
MTKHRIKEILLLGTGLIIIYTVAQHTASVWNFFLALLAILQPFLLGGGLAFVLNVPMRFFENRLLKGMEKHPFTQKLKRPAALLIVMVLVALVLYVVMSQLVPELLKTIESIFRILPQAFNYLNDWLKQYGYDLSQYIQTSVFNTSPDQIKSQIDNVLNLALRGAMFSTNVIGAVYSSVLQLFFTIMFTIYFLFAKERLARQFVRLGYAYLQKDKMDRVREISRMVQRTFSSFITGQCLEALILGTLFFVTMSLLGMPYVLLISVFIAIMALIPVIGAWLGCIMGGLLILMVNPMQALGFVALFLFLQQIEGNLIYPHVMGNAIGLPSIWVLFAVVLGDGLMGIFGMLLFIPTTSVLYALTREHVTKRLAQRGIDEKGETKV